MKRILVKVMFDSPHAYRAQPTILPHKNHPVQNVRSTKMEASYSDAVSRKDLSGSSLKFLSAEMNGLSTSHCHAVGGRKDLWTTLHRTGICR